MVPSMGEFLPKNARSILHKTLRRRHGSVSGRSWIPTSKRRGRVRQIYDAAQRKTRAGALSGKCSGHYTDGRFGGKRMPLIPSSVVEKSWRQALSRLESGRLEFIAPNGELTIAGGKLPGPNARFQIR